MLAEMIPLKKKETKRLLKQEASEDKFDYLWEGSLYSESLLTQKGLKRSLVGYSQGRNESDSTEATECACRHLLS